MRSHPHDHVATYESSVQRHGLTDPLHVLGPLCILAHRTFWPLTASLLPDLFRRLLDRKPGSNLVPSLVLAQFWLIRHKTMFQRASYLNQPWLRAKNFLACGLSCHLHQGTLLTVLLIKRYPIMERYLNRIFRKTSPTQCLRRYVRLLTLINRDSELTELYH